MCPTPAQAGHRLIYDLSNEFTDPRGAERAMRRSLNSKIKLQNQIIVKDQFQGLRNVGTDEIQNFTMKVMKKVKHDREEVEAKIIKFIMNIKLLTLKYKAQPQDILFFLFYL